MFRQTQSIPTQALRRWESLLTDLLHPDVELTVENFGALLSAFKTLRATGYRFDLGTLALMTTLERQATESIETLEDETDSDNDLDLARAA